jgi:hypothetical protein
VSHGFRNFWAWRKGVAAEAWGKHILVQAYSKMFVRKRARSISKENMVWEWTGLQRRSFNVMVNEKLGELLSILAGLILQQLSQCTLHSSTALRK